MSSVSHASSITSHESRVIYHHASVVIHHYTYHNGARMTGMIGAFETKRWYIVDGHIFDLGLSWSLG